MSYSASINNDSGKLKATLSAKLSKLIDSSGILRNKLFWHRQYRK